MKPESTHYTLLNRISSMLENIQAVVGGFFLFLMLIVVFIDVLYRLLGMPIIWLQNIAGFTFIWVVFFGASLGLKKGTHYCIELFPKTSKIFRQIMDVTIFSCEAIFILVLIIYGGEFAMMSMKRLVMPSGVPMFYAVVAIPLSGVCMLCYFIENVTNWIAKRSEEASEC